MFAYAAAQRGGETAKLLTFGVREERGHAALDEHGLVLQQRAHEAPRGQLAEQVDEQLDRALAEQQLLPLQGRLLRGRPRGGHRIIQHLRACARPLGNLTCS
jgi:hypothetical protein